ncbi:serine/threonine-protein kinase [Streptomyces sp. NPDC001922]|uniref:serine/threonine-protein kinase n=1 Tax=Streptomyces sp. NPDC001922 TaxID=3364624 RepID=UPI0036C86896
MEALRSQDPSRIGPHTLLARLGAGGMGQVFLARSPGGRQVAIKVIRDDFADSPEALLRFRREVETLRAVRSAYTANLVDASLESAPYWLATEYVPGPTLVQAVGSRGPFPADTCFRLFAALAEALADVHTHGVTHRDLKPHNIILSPVGPQLIDFGIARGAEQTALTQVGQAPGTPGYTAPEVITHNRVSGAADVFALGATMAVAATGRRPYGEGSMESVTYRVVHGEIDLDGVEPGLAELIRACVARDPSDRPDPSGIIERCAVTSSLADDPCYQPVAAPPDGAAAAPHDLETAMAAGLVPPGHGYVPTLAPMAQTAPSGPPSARSRRTRWLVAVGVLAALGLTAAAVIRLLPDGSGSDGERGGRAGAAPADGNAKDPAAPSGSASPGKEGGTGTAKAPAYIETIEPSRDYWTPAADSPVPGAGTCNLPAQERNEHFQMSIADADDPEAETVSDKGKISFRLKFPDPSLGKPYYVSVAVKPPHEIDRDTGKPYEGLEQQNLDLGYTSKPVDVFAGDASEFVDLTYPDDFRQFVRGKPYSDAIPLANDPGDWTVTFQHVREPKKYASIACSGFTVP